MVSLAQLSDEILALVVSLVGSSCVSRLYMSGYVVLQAKLRLPHVVEALEVQLSVRRPRWPGIVREFVHLSSLTVSCQVYSTCTFVAGVIVESIPRSVRHLRLKFANDFVSFFEVDLDACDVDYYNSDGLRLRDMSSLLPHLETFEFVGTVTHLDLQREFPSFLPRTLHTLRLSERYYFSPEMISLLPRTLRDLELTLAPTAVDAWENDDIFFPPELASFTCHELRSLTIIKKLPSTLTSLTFAPFDSEDPLEQDDLYAQLPKGLYSLDTPLISNFDARFAANLPRGLVRLACGFSSFSPKAMRSLPKTLEFWDAKSAVFDAIDLLLWRWEDAPRTLTHVPLEALKKIDAGIEEEWLQMPRALKNFALPLSALDDIDFASLAHLPQDITELTVWDSRKNRMTMSPMPQNWCKSLRILELTLLCSTHPLLIHNDFIAQCEVLQTFKLIISQNETHLDAHDALYAEKIPSSLTSLHSTLNFNLYAANLASRSWTRHLTALKLEITEACPRDEVYETVPRTLTMLSLRCSHPLPSTGFHRLPPNLTALELFHIAEGLANESLEHLPRRLASCFIWGSIAQTGTYDIQGLMSLPQYLENLHLPPSNALRERDLLPFLYERPCIALRIGTTFPSQAEDVMREYYQKKLTMGSARSRYGR